MGVGAIAAVAGTVLSGVFSSRSAKKQQKAQEKQAELQAKVGMWQQQYARRNQLEDRAYKEKAGGGYRQFYKGNQPVMAPAYTDPSSVQVIDPFAVAKKK